MVWTQLDLKNEGGKERAEVRVRFSGSMLVSWSVWTVPELWVRGRWAQWPSLASLCGGWLVSDMELAPKVAFVTSPLLHRQGALLTCTFGVWDAKWICSWSTYDRVSKVNLSVWKTFSVRDSKVQLWAPLNVRTVFVLLIESWSSVHIMFRFNFSSFLESPFKCWSSRNSFLVLED